MTCHVTKLVSEGKPTPFQFSVLYRKVFWHLSMIVLSFGHCPTHCMCYVPVPLAHPAEFLNILYISKCPLRDVLTLIESAFNK